MARISKPKFTVGSNTTSTEEEKVDNRRKLIISFLFSRFVFAITGGDRGSYS